MNTVTQILDSIAEDAARVDRTDGQLLDLFVRLRDEGAFAAVVRRHGPMVLSVCRRVLRNPADADDAFQAAFMVFARKAAAIGARHRLAQWLYGVAYNTARKLRRSNARRALREGPLPEGAEPTAIAPEPRDELFAILDDELNRLPERYRAVLVLCDLEGLTRKEAARLLNCPEGTVGGRLARARAMLAERLTRRGVVSAAGLLAAALAERTAAAIPPAALAAVVRAVGVDDLAGAASQGLISSRVAHTTEGVLKSMFATQLRTITAAVLCCGLVVACAVGAIHLANAQPDPKPKASRDPFAASRPISEQVPAKAAPADAEKRLSLIPLKKLDAKPTAEKLLKLLPDAVTVAAARDENALIVYATAKGADDVRLVLRTLGEELPKETKEEPAPRPKVSGGKAKTFTFRMKNAPWGEVFEAYSKLSGLALVTAAKPTGTFTFEPPAGAELTLAEITDIINEGLTQQKFILIRRHMTFFLQPADEKIDPTLIPRISLDALPERGRTELVQVVLPVRGADVPEIGDAVKKMLTPFGSAVAIKNALLVQDTAGNITRILKTLETLDKPAEPKADPAAPRPASEPKTYSVTFDKATWEDVCRWYARESGLTRAGGDALPAGTFTFNLPPPNVLEVLSPAYTLTELTDHINAALLKQNWLLVRNDRSFAVIPADEKVDPKFVTHSSREKLNAHGRYALVAVTIQFGKSDAEELVAGVHKKLTPFGELIRLPRSGGIIIRDLAGNLREIVKTYPGLLTVDPEAKP